MLLTSTSHHLSPSPFLPSVLPPLLGVVLTRLEKEVGSGGKKKSKEWGASRLVTALLEVLASCLHYNTALTLQVSPPSLPPF